jgi:hypothetical protein
VTDEALWLGGARPLRVLAKVRATSRIFPESKIVVADVVGRAAHEQVRLSIQKIGDPVAK